MIEGNRALQVLVFAVMSWCLRSVHGLLLSRIQRAIPSIPHSLIHSFIHTNTYGWMRRTTRVFSSIDSASDSNAIKGLYQSEGLKIIYKSSGVTIGTSINNNKAVRRTSKLSIEEYLKQKNVTYQCVDSTVLSVWDSGLIVVGLTPITIRFIKNCNRKYTFIAILSSNVTHTQDLPTPLGDIISEQKVICHATSSSHGNLYLVELKTEDFPVSDDAATIIPKIHQTLSASGFPIVDRSISLTGIKYTSSDTSKRDLVIIDISGENSCDKHQEFVEDRIKSLEIIHRAPSKFMKYMKREELAYRRLANNTTLTHSLSHSPSATVANTITFRGLRLTYPITSLRPRESSGVIVEACKQYLVNTAKPSILELGCASGALILSVVNEMKDRNITGLGIDSDKNILTYAEKNAKIHDIDTKVTFLEGDFTKLHVIKDLSSGGYSVIMSNPPYFDQLKIANRITSEGKHTLSTNGDGLECYERILQSLDLFYSHNKRYLLHPQGVVVFQIPGNKLSYPKVKEIVERNHYKVVELIYDKRARDGDVTDMIIRGIVCQSGKT